MIILINKQFTLIKKDFTNTVDDIEIEKLAELDENDLIKSIQVNFLLKIIYLFIYFLLS